MTTLVFVCPSIVYRVVVTSLLKREWRQLDDGRSIDEGRPPLQLVTALLVLCRPNNNNKMPFKRYMEVGRVVLVNYGPDAGKLAAVVDIVDQNKCLIDGPATGVARQVIPYARIALTDYTVPAKRNARQKSLTKAWKEADITAKWEASSWAKKLASKNKRASLSDFDRFKVMVAKKQKSAIIAKKMAELA